MSGFRILSTRRSRSRNRRTKDRKSSNRDSSRLRRKRSISRRNNDESHDRESDMKSQGFRNGYKPRYSDHRTSGSDNVDNGESFCEIGCNIVNSGEKRVNKNENHPRHSSRSRHHSRRSVSKSRTSNDSSDSDEDSRSSSSQSSSTSDSSNTEAYSGQPGDTIDDKYRIISVLGKGTFGKVLECLTISSSTVVAMKVIRAIERYVESALIEADILEDVCRRQKDNNSCDRYCVELFAHFSFLNHYCLVFEPLGLSIFEFLKANNYIGFFPSQTCQIILQLLRAVDFLHSSVGLIHTDIKPENLLLVSNNFTIQHLQKDKSKCRHHSQHSCGHCSRSNGTVIDFKIPQSTRIKCKKTKSDDRNMPVVIDFGGATYFDDRHKSRIINTRQYRSPEVLLELEWDKSSDLWSVGCVAVEILTGDVLFDVVCLSMFD